MKDHRYLPGLTLAYIGDAVYELYVRTYLVEQGYNRVKYLHKMAVDLVKASTQAKFILKLDPWLDEEEKIIVKRGRNAKSGHQPKNSTMIDYRLATAFEALIGYLHLSGREERIRELMEHLLGSKDLGEAGREEKNGSKID